MEFIDWSSMTTYTGALIMVCVITQLTKDIKFVKKIPTQLWSYVISLVVLYSAYFFTSQATLSGAVLVLFNSMIVSLAANGGFEALMKTFPDLFKTRRGE